MLQSFWFTVNKLQMILGSESETSHTGFNHCLPTCLLSVLKHLLTWRNLSLVMWPTCSQAERRQTVHHQHTDRSFATFFFFFSGTLLNTPAPNFRHNTVKPLKHSLMDPFNRAHRPEQTLSFMVFQKCKWSKVLTLSQGYPCHGLVLDCSEAIPLRVMQGTAPMFSVQRVI